jgi:hypothetical protein
MAAGRRAGAARILATAVEGARGKGAGVRLRRGGSLLMWWSWRRVLVAMDRHCCSQDEREREGEERESGGREYN